ncbi:MAG: hypothetical protein H0X24_15470 [Ktedonobacterales bacterium]|nr:hypothetical protein [Ktedonobacterales bacterium]
MLPQRPTASYPEPMLWKPLPARQLDDQRLARQRERNHQYDQVIAFKQQGHTTKQIAADLYMSVRTVTRWLATSRHDTRRRKRASIFDPFAPYVLERWQAGCHNTLQIWRELRERRFTGSYPLVYRFVNRLRHLDQHEGVPQGLPPTELPLHRYTLTPHPRTLDAVP